MPLTRPATASTQGLCTLLSDMDLSQIEALLPAFWAPLLYYSSSVCSWSFFIVHWSFLFSYSIRKMGNLFPPSPPKTAPSARLPVAYPASEENQRQRLSLSLTGWCLVAFWKDEQALQQYFRIAVVTEWKKRGHLQNSVMQSLTGIQSFLRLRTEK